GLLACRPRLESAWRRLPTVSDFMDVVEEGGERRIVEKEGPPLDGGGEGTPFHRGRGRLLHPGARLEALGYPDAVTGDATTVPSDQAPLLEVLGLKVHYPIRTGLLRRVTDHVRAVDGIDFAVYRGQTLGLVGESGCGKTTTGRAILRLQRKTAGTVRFAGQDVHALKGPELKAWRRKIQINFQDPYGSLNPRMTVGGAIAEAMAIHGLGGDDAGRRARAAALLEEVGLKPEHLSRYPHEFSGGQRQRIGIARALAVEPELIVCDESVSALDVSVQAQVLNLLRDLQEERGLTYLFISHDLSVVKFMSDMMAVMNAGKIVEMGPADAVYAGPREAYTKRLIDAIPNDSLANIRRRRDEREAAAGAA
ncbi:MAG: ATP-binding cassette domain-containing protein, partial [Myxococcota bacterium]